MTTGEVQGEPGLLCAVKRAIDRGRVPGRYLIAGSANVLLMHRVSESLAGSAAHGPDTPGRQFWPQTPTSTKYWALAGLAADACTNRRRGPEDSLRRALT